MKRFDDALCSPEYRALLRERYTRPGWGGSGYHHAEEVTTFASMIGARTVLDFGCGRGTLKPALPSWLDAREYDPGVVGKDVLPEKADLVVATDVLEHVETDRVDVTLRHLRSLALRGSFFIIALTEARERLADGRNAHLTIRPATWWLDRLVASGHVVHRSARRKGLFVWCWND
jgi:2-polyprenyl-3-methyl-5-hydroxy-6-metoxy-1,4-benzoquinol methylase